MQIKLESALLVRSGANPETLFQQYQLPYQQLQYLQKLQILKLFQLQG